MIYALFAACFAIGFAAQRIFALRCDLRELRAAYNDEREQTAAQLIAKGAEVVALRALLHEAAGLLMDERHRSRAKSGDARKTDNYGDWATKRDELVKRIGGAA